MNKLEKILNNFEDHAEFTCTFGVKWSEKGRGFGEYFFYWDKENKKMMCNNECDSKETVKKVLSMMVDRCEFVDPR